MFKHSRISALLLITVAALFAVASGKASAAAPRQVCYTKYTVTGTRTVTVQQAVYNSARHQVVFIPVARTVSVLSRTVVCVPIS